MGTERWKWVCGYEGLYQVSDHGRVRSVDRVVPDGKGGTKKMTGRVLRANPGNRFGHLAVALCNEGAHRTVTVHSIVAVAWIGPCPDGCQVRHGPGGKHDNSVGNLCYGTPSQNEHDKRRDGTHGGVAVVRSDGKEFISIHVAAEESGCSYTNIWAVCNGRRKSTGGYGWRYA
jgi:hypothetical protein